MVTFGQEWFMTAATSWLFFAIVSDLFALSRASARLRDALLPTIAPRFAGRTAVLHLHLDPPMI